MQAHLLVVHGDRQGEAAQQLERMVNALRSAGNTHVFGAQLLAVNESLFLPTVLRSLAIQGYTQIELVPWFLFAGPHVREDIPRLVQEMVAEFPHVQVHQQAPLGEDALFAHIIHQRIHHVS